jgi:hypothetical protein
VFTAQLHLIRQCQGQPEFIHQVLSQKKVICVFTINSDLCTTFAMFLFCAPPLESTSKPVSQVNPGEGCIHPAMSTHPGFTAPCSLPHICPRMAGCWQTLDPLIPLSFIHRYGKAGSTDGRPSQMRPSSSCLTGFFHTPLRITLILVADCVWPPVRL